jgi:hypothetical protein
VSKKDTVAILIQYEYFIFVRVQENFSLRLDHQRVIGSGTPLVLLGMNLRLEAKWMVVYEHQMRA